MAYYYNEFDSFEDGIFIKFDDLRYVNDADLYGLQTDKWYEVVNFSVDGVPVILLPDGDVFCLTAEELDYAVISEVYSVNEDEYDDCVTAYSDYWNFNPYATTSMSQSRHEKYLNTKYLDDLSVNVTEEECDKYIKAIEEMYIENEIDRLLATRNFKALEKLRYIKYQESI